MPEGFSRVAYDADTRIYTFRDNATGKLYKSDVGNSYGELKPVSSDSDSSSDLIMFKHTRTGKSIQSLPIDDDYSWQRAGSGNSSSTSSGSPAKTFSDFLPAQAIASASSPPPTTAHTETPLERLIRAVRNHHSGAPKMHGVVSALIRRSKASKLESEKGLLDTDSLFSVDIDEKDAKVL